jgi:hypothetical protein
MEVLMGLPIAFKAVFFMIVLVRTGDWKKTVLDEWSSNCTLLPHPAPYPFELQRLANGTFTWHGVKQIFVCSRDPEWKAFFRRLPPQKIALESPTTNRKGLGNGLAPPQKAGGSQ